MPADYERAVAYVRAHGDEFDQARLNEQLSEGSLLSREQEKRFLAGQRPDGGWPSFWAPDYSSLDATCFRLAKCESLGIGYENLVVEHAVALLRSRQRPDGSWEEDEAVRGLAPPWARPGELGPRLYLTANCGWEQLANSRGTGSLVTTDEVAQRAGDHLEQYLAEDGSLPSFLQSHWLAAALWIRLGRTALAMRTVDYLATRIVDDASASSLVWMLTTLGALGIPRDHPLGQKATALLTSQQREDGSWQSDEETATDSYVTVEAVRALLKWGAI